MSIWTVAANTGGNILTNLVNRAFKGKDMRMELAANKEMQDYAFQQNMDAWHMMNQYNAPVAQMERLKEAGLNPNLVYGQGVQGATGQAKGSPSAYQAPKADFKRGEALKDLNILQQYQSFKLADAQTRNLRNQADTRELENKYLEDTIDSRIRGAIVSTLIQEHNLSASEANAIVRQAEARIADEKQDAVLKKYQEDADRAESERIIRDIEKGWYEEGIRPQDPWWQRQLDRRWKDFIDWWYTKGGGAADPNSYLDNPGRRRND